MQRYTEFVSVAAGPMYSKKFLGTAIRPSECSEEDSPLLISISDILLQLTPRLHNFDYRILIRTNKVNNAS